MTGAFVSKQELKHIAARVSPTKFLTAPEYLAALYQEFKSEIGQYSYIKFTEDLGFGACNAMYLIIHGQRTLTVKGAQKIVAALGLTGTDRKYLLKLVEATRLGDPSEREAAFDRLVSLKARALPTKLDRRQLDFYNCWYNAAILELLSLPDAEDGPLWLSTHLMPSVTPLRVKKSLDLLKKLGFIVFDKELRRLVPSRQEVSTGSEVVGLAVIRYHQQMIALAKDALTDVDPDERDISAVTIAVPSERVAELKDMIQRFRRELLDFSSNCQEANEIAQINIQLFPIARSKPRKTVK